MTTTSQEKVDSATSGEPVYTGDGGYDEVFGQLMLSMTLGPAVQAAARLGLADAVGDSGATADELASALGLHARSVDRLMRALAAFHIFGIDGHGRYGQTRVSQMLRSDQPSTMLYLLLMSGSEWNTQSWHGLPETVRTGEPEFVRRYGQDIFDYFADNPREASHYHRAMTILSATVNPVVTDALDTNGVQRLIDVGGGGGAMLRSLLERHPEVDGVLFDIEQALTDVEPELVEGPLAKRCTVIAGDAAREVPVEADLYLLKHVLHMWGDERAIQVLRNIAAIAPPGARVVLAEQTLSGSPSDAYTMLMDLQMLATVYGGERTEEQFAELFDRAGLEYRGITMNSSLIKLLEGVVKT